MDDLAVREARFRARFEQSRLPQVECDIDGRLTLVNDALCALVGQPREELIGRPASSLNHSDDPGTTGRRLDELLAGDREDAQYQRVLRGADGSPVPVFVDATLLRDPDGRPLGAASYFQDLRELHESERRRHRQQELQDAFERLAGELALVSDSEGTLLYVSPAVSTLLGYDVDEVLSRDGFDFVHPDDEERVRHEYELMLTEGGTRSWTVRLRTVTGEWRWLEQTCSNLLDSSIGGVVSNLRDITEQVLAQEALRVSEARFRTIAETAQEGICTVDSDGQIVYANARMAAIAGIPLADLLKLDVFSLLHPDATDDVAFRLRTRAQRGPERYELRYPHPDGSERVVAVSAAPLPSDDGKQSGSLALVSDITDLRRYERELAEAALRDGLTGLPNRALLTDRLEMVLARAKGCTGLLLISLDRLQLVNQSYGHRAGDRLLSGVTERLLSVVRRSDSVGRIGGDTFAVACEETDEPQSMTYAAELLDALAEPFDVEGNAVHVTASIGVAVAVASDATTDQLLRYADVARQAARTAGGNRVQLFDRSLSEQITQRFSLATDLREALAADALAVHHQPIVDLRSGSVVGLEALARWDHPQRGAVPPDQLLSVALLTGLAGELDRWVLQRAITQHARLRAAGCIPADAFLSINLAAVSLLEVDLDAELVGAAAAAGLPAELLVLEITEMAALEHSSSSGPALRRLREQGVGIVLDDFGTGHGSLSFLRDLPVTALKIAQTFIQDLETNRDALAIVASIVDLARAVGITAMAEGVESVQQVAQLHRLGCVHGQGQLWSPPVPASEVELSTAWTRPFETTPLPPPLAAQRTAPPADDPVGEKHGLDRLLELHRGGASLATIASALNSEGFRRPNGSRWHRTSVARVVASAAYPSLAAEV